MSWPDTPTDTDRDGADALVHAIAARLKRLRDEKGWSAAALARRAGIAKSTLTQLELGRGNPGVETLWALARALGVPFDALLAPDSPDIQVVRATQGQTTYAEQTDYSARLIARLRGSDEQSLFDLHIGPGASRESAAHIPGTVEHLLVTAGQLTAGPIDAEITLGIGDYLRFPGDLAHRYTAGPSERAAAILIMQYH